jgi:hypothetical protein
VKLVAGADLAGGGVGGAAGGWVLTGGEPGQLLVGAAAPLDTLFLDFGPGVPAELGIEGAVARQTVLGPDGGTGFLLALDDPRAVHPMWWSEDDWYLYGLSIDPAAAGVPFTITHRGGAGGRP